MANEVIPKGQQQYRAYLLRLWQAESSGRAVWRASLEDSHTGERRGFATISDLVAFLKDQTYMDLEESTDLSSKTPAP